MSIKTSDLTNIICAHSPYLTSILNKNPDFLNIIETNGFDHTLKSLIFEAHNVFYTLDLEGTVQHLYRIKHLIALTVACADISQSWDVKKTTKALSLFADFSLKTLLKKLLSVPSQDSGITIISLGKLGARELNYSSDIDLMVVYDQDKVSHYQPNAGQFVVQLTQKLVNFIQGKQGLGYIFRPDLRLRPDPLSNPIALSLKSCEKYYTEIGQNWERAAMIKARHSAGDRETFDKLQHTLDRFIWRRSLDFYTIRDIRALRRQMFRHHGHETLQLYGYNVKIGRGGIRDIEFFIQTEQLVWGGRYPQLRVKGTFDALYQLNQLQFLSESEAQHLSEAYTFYRTLEHRLQMVEDQQTHTLPETKEAFDNIAQFMGFENVAAFEALIQKHHQNVIHKYDQLFELDPPLTLEGSLVFTGIEDDPETSLTLEKLGFSDVSRVQQLIRGWHFGRYRCTKSEKSRQILTELIPTLLKKMAETPNPDQAIIFFDDFLSKLPAGIVFFSLLQTYPHLLDTLLTILGTAPRLALFLSQHPQSFEALVMRKDINFSFNLVDLKRDFQQQLKSLRDYDEILSISRLWAREKRFLIGVKLLQKELDPIQACQEYALVAEAVLHILVPHIVKHYEKNHTRPTNSQFALVAFGKLGMGYIPSQSDLDMVLIYEGPLEAMNFYVKLCQRIVTALSAHSKEGKLYDVDLRLRPSGTSGALAVEWESFIKYQEQEAWAWEHMALTRARTVFAENNFNKKINPKICDILTHSRHQKYKLAKHIDEIREKIKTSLKPRSRLDVKYMEGGLLDVEFICQFLQIKHGTEHPDILEPDTFLSLKTMISKHIIMPNIANTLYEATALWIKIQTLLRLSYNEEEGTEISPGLQKFLFTTLQFATQEALMERVTFLQTEVSRLYQEIVKKEIENDS